MAAIPPDEWVPPPPPQPGDDEPSGLVNTQVSLLAGAIVSFLQVLFGCLLIFDVINWTTDQVGMVLALPLPTLNMVVMFFVVWRKVYSERTVYRIDPAATRR